MREITIDGKEVRVRATPLTLLFYRQEFGSDLIGDLLKLQRMEQDPSAFDSILLLQVIWALAKTVQPKDFPSFERWVASLEVFDFSEPGLLEAVMEEAFEGFFRSQAGQLFGANKRRKRA